MEKELYDAAIQGNVSQLTTILNQDPLILHRFDSLQTPLHVSAKHGQLEFTLELLKYNPQLIDSLDSHRSSPLHSAASAGRVDIVKSLILINPDVCFVCDEEGMNPVHVAAIKGQVAVLDELVRSMPSAAKETAWKKRSILHLCVKYNKLECLMLLVNSIGDGELLNCTDCDGNNVLHLAVAAKQTEILKFLLSKNYWIDKNSKNNNGLTPMDTFHQSRRDPKSKTIYKILKRSDVRSCKNLQPNMNWNKHINWLDDHRSTLMLIASLIAQMAFTAGLNPPGGLHQGGSDIGYAVASDDKNRQYDFNLYLGACSVSLFSSLCIILILISGLPCRTLTVYVSMIAIWIAILPMPLVYIASINIFTPNSDVIYDERIAIKEVVIADRVTMTEAISTTGVLLWVLLILVVVFGHLISVIVDFFRGCGRLVKNVFNCCRNWCCY